MYRIDKNAPEETKEAARHYYLRYSGPGGLTESDDMESWSGATDACKGAISQQLYFNYQMKLGYSKPDCKFFRDAVYNDYTEENARSFCRRWVQFMSEMSLDELNPSMEAGGAKQ